MPAPPAPRRDFDPDAPLSRSAAGFLAMDLASALGLPLFDPARQFRRGVDFSNGGKLSGGAGLLGAIRKIPMWWWRPMAAPT